MKSSPGEKDPGQAMFSSKSITFDENDLGSAADAAGPEFAFSIAEIEFIERLQSGDADAFDLLVSRFSGDIFALLFRITQDPDEAGDLTQDTFLKAFRSIRRFRGRSELKTWLYRIAINESRNRFRWWKRRHREKTISLDETVGNSDMLVHETLSCETEDPETSLERREYHQALERALQTVPEVFREALVLYEIEGQSYQQIAEILDVSIGTVKSRIARGREELRQKLKDF